MWLRISSDFGRYLAVLTVFLVPTLLALDPHVAQSQGIGNQYFERTWARTDRPVMDGQTARTWMWGPIANTPVVQEPYAESPGGMRDVQYFDKSRMEITHPNSGDPESIWYVTNGLLSLELISGKLQLGDSEFEQHQPAEINVAGDIDDMNAPTYKSFSGRLDDPPAMVGALITQRIDRDGTVTPDPSLSGLGVTAAVIDDVTSHAIAGPFWDFMRSSGLVWDGQSYVTDQLFENPFFATGRPITEAYWASVLVAGTQKNVLIQCFERRCLTFTPDNEPTWQVEAGNIGQHYHYWLYELIPAEPPDPKPPVELPAPPSDVIAEAIDADTIRLTWIDNSDNEERFEISPDAIVVILDVAADVTTVDIPAETDQQACFKVRAVNSAGASAWSEDWACAVPRPTPAPISPSELTAVGRITTGGSPEIVVAWQDNSDNEFEFVVYRWPEGEDSQAAPIAYLGMSTEIFVDVTVGFDTVWCYAVAASGQGGESPRSNAACASVSTPVQAPAAPSSITAVSNFDNSMHAPRLTVTWSDNATDEEGFNIYRFALGQAPGDQPIGTTGVGVEEFHDWAVQGGETWCYAVSAFDNDAESDKVTGNTACALVVDIGPPP